MTALARAAPRRGDGMITVHNNNSSPAAGRESARRELATRRRAKRNLGIAGYSTPPKQPQY